MIIARREQSAWEMEIEKQAETSSQSKTQSHRHL
jgi:hypothetical protein